MAGYPNSRNKDFTLNTDFKNKLTRIMPIIVKVDSALRIRNSGQGFG